MVNRGFHEARLAASLERRQTELSRQLSAFLADSSLADQAPTTRSRRCCGSSPSRRARSSGPCAAWPRSRSRASLGRQRAARIPRRSGAGRRSCGGSTCSLIYRLIDASGGSVCGLGGDELARTPLLPRGRRRAPAPGMGRRIADRPRRHRARRHTALRQARGRVHARTTSPRSCISPRWRRRRSRGRSSITGEERKGAGGRGFDRGPLISRLAARRDCRRARLTGGGLRRLVFET